MAFGLFMGAPLYASFFVEWKPGIQGWFSTGAIIADTLVSRINRMIDNSHQIVQRLNDNATRAAEAVAHISQQVESGHQQMASARTALTALSAQHHAMADNLQNLMGATEQMGQVLEPLATLATSPNRPIYWYSITPEPFPYKKRCRQAQVGLL